MFFQIKNERFKMTSVSRYSSTGEKSIQTGQYYIKVYFGQKERLFAFEKKQECDEVLAYMDKIFKVQVI